MLDDEATCDCSPVSHTCNVRGYKSNAVVYLALLPTGSTSSPQKFQKAKNHNNCLLHIMLLYHYIKNFIIIIKNWTGYSGISQLEIRYLGLSALRCSFQLFTFSYDFGTKRVVFFQIPSFTKPNTGQKALMKSRTRFGLIYLFIVKRENEC